MEQTIFESKSISKAYFTMAVPVVLSLVITIVYNITDTYFIALTKNTDLVAGVSLCAPLFTLVMAFGNIFGQGGSSLISRLLGMNDEENLNRVSSFCFYIAIVFGIVVGGLMLLFRVPILGILGADSDTMQYALPYYTWLALGAPIVILSYIHTNLLRAEGMSKESMFATICGSLVNIVLDPILIFGLNLGSAGAAMATVIGFLCTDVFGIIIVRRKSKVLSMDASKWRISGEFISQIFSIGLAAALSNVTQSFCLILTNQCLLSYGNDKIAAMGIVQKVSMIVMLVIVGFSFGGAPLIGYTYGSGNQKRLKEIVAYILKFLCVVALAMSLIMIVLAPQAIRIFLSDPELVAIGAWMLRAQVLGMTFMAIVLVINVYFQAIGKVFPSLILALSRQGIVFVIVLVIAMKVAGYQGVIMTQFLADAISAILAVFLYARLRAR